MKALIPVAMILVISAGWAADVPPLPDDPTQPPMGAVAADGSMAVSSAVGLTSVVLPKNGKPAAVIDGQVVPLGGTVRDAKLVRISENSVVLEGIDGEERLFLTPSVEKTMSSKKAAPRRQREQ